MMWKKNKKKTNPENKKLSPIRVFENNTLLLIASFLCATIVWFGMMMSNTDDRAVVVANVPIEIELSEAAQEAGVRIFSQNYSYTDVSVTGSSSITSKVTTEDIGVSASLDPSLSMLTGSSMQQATISLRAYKKGNTLASYEVESVSPSEITVVYDKYKEIQLTLDNKVQYTAANGYYAVSAPTFSTDIVTISGPESEVGRVARAAVDYAFTDELTQSKSISCKITLYDVNDNVIDPTEKYITLSDDTVDVSVMVTSRQTVLLEADIRNIPESFSAQRITIDPESIEIAGDSETISKYTKLTLSTPINFLDVTPENNTFTVPIPVPNGVTNISKVETATVTFNLNGYSQTRLTTDNINIINVPEGKQAALTTKSMTVTIVGTAAQLSKLTGESVFCTIDLSLITDPSGSLVAPVTVTVNNADSCWATGTYTAHLTITDVAASSDPEAE